MSTATAPAETLRKQVEAQRRVVGEAEAVVRRREEWDAEQRTTASRAGLVEARRDLGFYRNQLTRMEGELASVEAGGRP